MTKIKQENKFITEMPQKSVEGMMMKLNSGEKGTNDMTNCRYR